MVKDFEASLYKDEYQVKLREIIEQKIAGKDIKASAPEVQVNAIDIMEALKQSLAKAGVKND
jgi:DNA end-binding protein Ku